MEDTGEAEEASPVEAEGDVDTSVVAETEAPVYGGSILMGLGPMSRSTDAMGPTQAELGGATSSASTSRARGSKMTTAVSVGRRAA